MFFLAILIIGAMLFVAYANGANDNFKGFATVWGSQTLSYRMALTLATVATVAGSLTSLVLAGALVKQFSGAGLVPDAIASAPPISRRQRSTVAASASGRVTAAFSSVL